MKIFDLQCGAGHRFEGWFASAQEFAAQKEQGLVGCPSCGAHEVQRVPSATRFNSGAQAPAAKQDEPGPQDALALAQKLYSRMLDELLNRTEDVGTEFPAEARRIHYKEATERPIRGLASDDEHAELLDEGIAVARLPMPPAKRWN